MALYSDIASAPATPFYHYDMELLEMTLAAASAHAKPHAYQIHYALKANVEPEILRKISSLGFGADCVSGWEITSAIENGFHPRSIVYAGVGKTDAEIRTAMDNEIFCFNCESLEEIEVINQIAASMNRKVTIALRINPAVEPETHKYIATGQSESKFGISYREIRQMIRKMNELTSIEIAGLHFHIGSSIINMRNFEELSIKATRINEWFLNQGFAIKHLNMGGGLGINYANPDAEPIPDFENYFNTFAKNLRVRDGQTVHFELGRALVGQCGELITRVLYTKTTASGEQFLIVDAGMTELIRPALYSASHKIENLTAQHEKRPNRPVRYYIGGPICESSDIFAYDIEFPLSARGDLLSIRSTGAYGSVMSSSYNLRPRAPRYFSDNR